MKTKMLSLTLLVLINLLLSGCKDQIFNGSEELVTVSKALPTFTKIIANDIVEVNVVQGDAQSVEVIVNENLQSQIKTTVRDNTLSLSLKSGSYSEVTFIVNIQIPNLEKIELHGDAKGDVRFATNKLRIESYDAAELDLRGSSNELNASLKGAGSIKGFTFVTDILNVNSRGASELNINVNSEINGTVEEGAIVRYLGNPIINASTREGGRIVNAN